MPRISSPPTVFFRCHLRSLARAKGVTLTEVARETRLHRLTVKRYTEPLASIDAEVTKKLMEYFQLSDINQLFSLQTD